MPPDVGAEVRNAVLDILADVPLWMKPDLYGRFEKAAPLATADEIELEHAG